MKPFAAILGLRYLSNPANKRQLLSKLANQSRGLLIVMSACSWMCPIYHSTDIVASLRGRITSITDHITLIVT